MHLPNLAGEVDGSLYGKDEKMHRKSLIIKYRRFRDCPWDAIVMIPRPTT